MPDAIFWRCLQCGMTLKGAPVEQLPGVMHTTNRSWMGFVQFKRVRYTCPRCGAPNTRQRRVHWGGDEGKH